MASIQVMIRNYFCFFSLAVLCGTLIGVDAIQGVASLGNEKAALAGGSFSTEGGSYRQDFCERFEEFASNNSTDINIRSALSGEEISVVLLPGQYFNYDSATGIDPVYPGIHAQILDYMAEKGNFTWRNSFALWSRDEMENRSYTELLQWGVEKYDVVAGTFSPTAERMNLGINFVEGHFDGTLVIIRNTQPVGPKLDPWNWFRPFTFSVWLAIMAVVVFSSFVYQFLDYVASDLDHAQKTFRKRVIDNLYLSFLNFTGNYSYEPKTVSARAFGVFFAFWAMLVTASYTANLASILVITNMPATKLHSFQDAIDQRLKTCVLENSHSEDYLRNRYPGSIPYLAPLPKIDQWEALLDGTCDILVTNKQEFGTARFKKQHNPFCLLEKQGAEILSLSEAFTTKIDPGLRCTDLVNEVLSYYIREMTENGFLEKKWKEHTEHWATPGHCGAKGQSRRLQEQSKRNLQDSDSTTSSTSSPYEDVALDLREMAGTMLFQILGSVIAVIIALLSGCDRKTKTKRNTRQTIINTTNSNFSESSNTNSENLLQIQLNEISRQLESMNDFSRQLKDLNENVSQMQKALNMDHTVSTTYDKVGMLGANEDFESVVFYPKDSP